MNVVLYKMLTLPHRMLAVCIESSIVNSKGVVLHIVFRKMTWQEFPEDRQYMRCWLEMV